MDIGMLWYDDTQRALDEKVTRAVEHYKTKYGETPTVCFVNPAVLEGKEAPEAAGGLALRPARTVLPNHFWIGVGVVGKANPTARTNGNGKNGHGKKARKA